MDELTWRRVAEGGFLVAERPEASAQVFCLGRRKWAWEVYVRHMLVDSGVEPSMVKAKARSRAALSAAKE